MEFLPGRYVVSCWPIVLGSPPWGDGNKLSICLLKAYFSFQNFPQPPLCQHRSVIIVNSKAGWSMEMLNKASGLLPQRLCETRFARRCVPLNISRKAHCLLSPSPTLLCAFRAPLLEVVLNSEFFTLSSKWSCFLRNGQPKGFSFSETERQWNP